MKKDEIPQLTGLRALAAWWVVLFHSGYMLQPLSNSLFLLTRAGYLGVDVFFVLSGFVIAYNYMDNQSRSGWERWREFFSMRFARLYPVHLFTLLLSLCFYSVLTISSLHTRKDFSGWTTSSFAANVLMIQAWLPYPHDSWNNASWSISSEWFAYLLFPLIVIAGIRRIPPRFTLIAAISAATIPGAVLVSFNVVPFACLIEVSFEFLAGCIIYVSFISVKDHATARFKYGGLLLLGTAAFVALSASRVSVSQRWAVSVFPLLVMYLAVSTGLVRKVMCSRLLVYWGKVSYSLYMTHNVTLWLLKYALPEHHNFSDTVRYAIYLVAIGGAAALTYHFVEEPSRLFLRGVIRRSEPEAVPALT